MRAVVEQAGERVELDSRLAWVDELLEEAVGGHLRTGASGAEVRIEVERSTQPFTTRRWEPLGRGMWTIPGELVVENACTSGFDLHVAAYHDTLCVRARWRPPLRDRVAARVLSSRFHLLARSVLLQYPALAWAGRRGRAPLHAAACQAGNALPLLAGPGGVGKSTLVLAEVEAGAIASSDNLCVSDGIDVFGLAEPARVEGAPGREMPHGRREMQVPWATSPLTPDRLVVLRRVRDDAPSVRRLEACIASRVLEAGTYSSGELRRFWPFVATLALALPGIPPHPPVHSVVRTLADRLPASEVLIGCHPVVPLRDLVDSREEPQCQSAG